MDFLDAVRKLESTTADLNELDPPDLRKMFPNAVEVAVALVCLEEGSKILRQALGYGDIQSLVKTRVEIKDGGSTSGDSTAAQTPN